MLNEIQEFNWDSDLIEIKVKQYWDREMYYYQVRKFVFVFF